MQSSYNRINNILGLLVLVIATFTYVSTMAPTASFWDCGEYISTAVKLQVGHPPGAPLFQLTGNFFSRFAFGDVTKQAAMVNLVSALSSAFTILFLFWTITAIGKKFSAKFGELNDGRIASIFGGALVGALAYTFSDSFWYSAVEGEVYAMSSLFTAIAFWAILKWEAEVDHSNRAGRWLVFIAFMIGLSIGVHILVFLTIPAIVMTYFYKKDKEISTKKFIIYNGIAVVVLGLIFAVIIPLVLKMFGSFEIFFVNSLGMPFNSGTVFTVLVLGAACYFGLSFTRKKELPLWNTLILSTLFIILGYSTFVTLAIRSNANTPIDENNPEDAMSLLAYYNREQYGEFPILYGQYFNAPLDQKNPFSDGKPVYKKDEESGKYIITDDRKASVRNFADSHKGFFPRMWNEDGASIQNYVQIAGLKNKEDKPTFSQNMKFFFDYQIGHMWWRYFMWNFAGRQNDEQHRYEYTKGNWISGISFIDKARLGPQDNLPYHMATNKARNVYYFLPFILGLIGLYFHFKKDSKNAWVISLFFLMTGLAIGVYLNHKPFEPRERDYAYVGSFYAFAIWIALGVQSIYELLTANKENKTIAMAISAVCLVLVPGVMAKENWDDHDRSERYLARDVAKAYLDSCEKNAILFTNGDNDTFPLWYIQEIEGYRTDVRVVNLSLLNTDWYIDQQKRAAYEAKGVPFDFENTQYRQGTRDVIYFQENPRIKAGRWMASDFLNWVKSDDPSTKFKAYGNKQLQYYPTKKLRVPIDKEMVLEKGVVPASDSSKIVDYIDWTLNSNVLTKRDLMVVDLIANNNWDRPIYFSVTVGNSSKAFFWLEEYFQLEGLAYRFIPIKTPTTKGSTDYGRVAPEIMKRNLTEKFDLTNFSDLDVYHDETNRRVSYNLANSYSRLAMAYVGQNNNAEAIRILDEAQVLLPEEKYSYNYFTFGLIEAYYQAGAIDKAKEMINKYADRLDEEISYYGQFSTKERTMIQTELRNAASYYQMLLRLHSQYEIQGSNMERLEQSDLYKRYRAALQPLGMA